MKIYNFRVLEKGTPYIWQHSVFAKNEDEARKIVLAQLSCIVRKPKRKLEIIECALTEV